MCLKLNLSLLIAITASTLSLSAWAGPCDTPPDTRFFSNGWGLDATSQRYQADTALHAGNARELQLKWAWGLSTNRPRVFPLVSKDTLFIGDAENGLLALDSQTGCVRWKNTDIDDFSSALAHGESDGRHLLITAGRMSGVQAVDAGTGETVWHVTITEDNPVPMYSGSPLVFEDKVFVPLSSMEIGLSANPFYGCCTTSGGIAALDLATGKLLWHTRTIPDQPQVTGRHYLFVEEWGPSGAPVWGGITLDAKRRQLYFGTGQNYSRPATATSDAIMALHLDTGAVAWVMQATQDDAFNMACTADVNHPNCPKPMGPDVDFGAPPILTQLSDGTDVVLAGQKSGDVWAIKPDNGEVMWQTRIGRGGALGGIHWGMAVNPNQQALFVPISDVPAIEGPGEPEPGMFAVDINTGKPLWSTPRPPECEGERCWNGLSAAITAASDIIVAGSLDGLLEVYEAGSGDIVWSFDTLRDFDTVNNVPAHGGSFDAHGPLVAGNLLIVVSGYATFGQKPGNALLVFELPQGSLP